MTVQGQKVDEQGSPYFECPRCKKPSHHPRDRHEGYCNVCKWWTGNPDLERAWQEQNAKENAQASAQAAIDSLVQDWRDV